MPVTLKSILYAAASENLEKTVEKEKYLPDPPSGDAALVLASNTILVSKEISNEDKITD